MPIEELYILHHTHVDVGYTDLQPLIYEKHVEYIGQALDYCRATDDYPDDARFRWINEFCWPVVRFLKERPERAEELLARLREGRMELCGLYLDPTELYDRRSLEVALRPALELSRQHGFDLTTVMTTDIPGQGWSLPDVMAAHALWWLSVSPNAMVSTPILVPRPFYWVGPRGSRVLVWFTDWRKGWYGEGHVLGFLQGFEVARANVLQYLDLLASEGYPWRALALHMAADNYPPLAALPDLVRIWNEEVGQPRMRMATNREFFERMTALHGEQFPSYRAAWPDWWSEGLGSAAFETALSRETHCRLERIEALQKRVGDQRDLWPIWEDLLLFDEHTWGCQNMALEPYSFRSRASWTLKSAHIYRAYDRTRRVEDELAERLSTPADAQEAGDYRDAPLHKTGPGAGGVVLFNPLGRDFHGAVALPDLPAEADGLVAPGEPPAPVQRSAPTALAPAQTWSVLAVPPGATRDLRPVGGLSNATGPRATAPSLQNDFYRLEYDDRGRLTSLLDLETGTELLDTRAPWGFAEVIHEVVTGSQDRDAIWEKGQIEIPYGKRRTDAPFRREGALERAEILQVQEGPVFASLTWQSTLPFVRHMETEVRLWRGLRRIDVQVRLDKQPREAYESLYVAFPFNLERPRAFIHSCDAVFEAEAEQLPGTCRDYYYVQHFAALQGDQGWVVMCPVEAPLVQLGEITFGRWADHLRLDRACFYSWLANNFWYTNFPGYQHGILRFRFVFITGQGAVDLEAAEAFARAVRVGVIVR